MAAERDPIVTVLTEQHAELTGLLADLDDTGWDFPSRCDGWSVTDVVLHLAQSDELAIASLRGEFARAAQQAVEDAGGVTDVDAIASIGVERERGAPGPAVRDRWQTSADELVAVLDACDPTLRVDWVAGRVTARTLATTRLAETWIHTGDIAEALGVEVAPSDRLWHVARLAWRTLPYAFSRAGRELGGPVAFRLMGPNGDAWDFVPDDPPLTTIGGDAVELCAVAARRSDPATTSLHGEGPDAEVVLELVRTYA